MTIRLVKRVVLIAAACLALFACNHNSSNQDSDQAASPPWPVPADAREVRNPLPDKNAAAREGEAIFNQQCLVCHGTGGDGKGPDAARFSPPPTDLRLKRVQQQTEGEMYYKISNGRAPMPAFQPGLSDEQRWKLVSYVRTLHQ